MDFGICEAATSGTKAWYFMVVSLTAACKNGTALKEELAKSQLLHNQS